MRPQSVERTAEFDKWLHGLSDDTARRAIVQRIVRIEAGLFGDVASVGGGVSEIRVDVGAGYRAYFHKRGLTVTLLLCGGDKSTQAEDIARAQKMVSELKAAAKATYRARRKRGKEEK